MGKVLNKKETYSKRTDNPKLVINGLDHSGVEWLAGILSAVPGYDTFPVSVDDPCADSGLKEPGLIKPGQVCRASQNFSNQFIKKGKAHHIKTVYVFRDVRDAVISSYNSLRYGNKDHYLKFKNLPLNEACGPDHLLKWCSVAKNYGDVRRWLEASDVITVSYEKLRENTAREVQRILKQLSIKLPLEAIERICANNSLEGGSGTVAGPEVDSGPVKFEAIGYWKNYLNSAVRDYLKELYGEMLIQYGYETCLTWNETSRREGEKTWVGWVDRISNSRIFGWVRDKEWVDPVSVVLYINDQEIMRTTADRFRQDLLDNGIHPEGRCAFEFNIEGVVELKALGKVQVRIEGDCDEIPKMGYADWTRQFSSLNDADRKAIRKHVDSLPYKPLVSIIMPVYNTPVDILRAAVESVRNQLYTHWQLCIADDASTDPGIRKELQRYQENEPRIKVVYRETNGHISEASNSALQLVEGEYVALLDHDDELTEDALYRVVNELNEDRDLDIIFSDEDKIDLNGKRHDPHFKPNWNPDYFLATNYVCHLCVIRSSLVKKVNGFRKGFEGAQDYDLFLRCYRETSSEKIRHIPCVLYHWRMMENSTAQSIEAKPYAIENGKRALEEYLKSTGRQGKVSPVADCTMYRIQYPLPKEKPLVSIIIPTKDKRELLEKCINSIVEKTDYSNYEILVVNNQSKDEPCLRYLENLQNNKIARVIEYDHPFNFSTLNNHAARKAKGDLLCFLNNDTEVISPQWLAEMVSQAIRPEIGAVGAKLLYGNGAIQHAGAVLGMGGVAGHVFRHMPGFSPGYFGRLCLVQNYSCVTAACMVIRREIFDQVKGFEEKLEVTFNDVDLCLRIHKAGYRNLWTPYATLYHHESKSRGADNTPDKQARFKFEGNYIQNYWGDYLLRDPYFNLNFSLESDQCDLAFPPRVQQPWKQRSQTLPVSLAPDEPSTLEPWINKSFTPLDAKKADHLKGKRKTVIVVGVGRGGTSLLSGALHRLGVFMGDKACSPIYEDVRLAKAFENNELDEAQAIISEYNRRHKIWGLKRLGSLNYLNDLIKFTENPVFLFIFKDIFSIANRNKISMNHDLVSGLESALADYGKIIEFIKTHKPCGFAISYEKAFEFKKELVDGLIENLEIPANPQQVNEALEFIARNPKDYLNCTRSNHHIGYVGRINNSKIVGWTRNKGSLTPVAVNLYVNNRMVMRAYADQFRQDLLDKRIHPEGKCSFEFDIEGVVELNSKDVVQVRVEGDTQFLKNVSGSDHIEDM